MRRRDLGLVLPQDTGFKIASDPDTVRPPDVGFVSRERLGLIPDEGYAALAPDLVAQVVSPADRPGEALAKVGDWLAAGIRTVWLVYPDRTEARVYRGDGTLSILRSDESLDGENVLPSFSCPLEAILA